MGVLEVITIPALMVNLSMTLRPRVNRVVNVVVASQQIPVMLVTVVGWSSDRTVHDGVTIGVEIDRISTFPLEPSRLGAGTPGACAERDSPQPSQG